jgi:hypothetical protein
MFNIVVTSLFPGTNDTAASISYNSSAFSFNSAIYSLGGTYEGSEYMVTILATYIPPPELAALPPDGKKIDVVISDSSLKSNVIDDNNIMITGYFKDIFTNDEFKYLTKKSSYEKLDYIVEKNPTNKSNILQVTHYKVDPRSVMDVNISFSKNGETILGKFFVQNNYDIKKDVLAELVNTTKDNDVINYCKER